MNNVYIFYGINKYLDIVLYIVSNNRIKKYCCLGEFFGILFSKILVLKNIV